MVAYDVSVNVAFFGGADFNPPPPLGTVDRSRYIKVTILEDVQGRTCASGSDRLGAFRAGNERHLDRRLLASSVR
jgi:hypothetical protein